MKRYGKQCSLQPWMVLLSASPCVDANVSSAPLPGLNFTVYSLDSKIYSLALVH